MSEKVTVKFDGCIRVSTDTYIGLSPYNDRDVGHWIPKSVLGSIEYDKEGDSKEIWKNRRIRSLQVADWFALKEGLV